MALFFTEGLATLFLWLSCRGSPQTTRQGAGSFRGRSKRISLCPSGPAPPQSRCKIKIVIPAAAAVIAIHNDPVVSEAVMPLLGDSNEVVRFTAAAAIMRLGKISSAQDYWCAERPAIG